MVFTRIAEAQALGVFLRRRGGGGWCIDMMAVKQFDASFPLLTQSNIPTPEPPSAELMTMKCVLSLQVSIHSNIAEVALEICVCVLQLRNFRLEVASISLVIVLSLFRPCPYGYA